MLNDNYPPRRSHAAVITKSRTGKNSCRAQAKIVDVDQTSNLEPPTTSNRPITHEPARHCGRSSANSPSQPSAVSGGRTRCTGPSLVIVVAKTTRLGRRPVLLRSQPRVFNRRLNPRPGDMQRFGTLGADTDQRCVAAGTQCPGPDNVAATDERDACSGPRSPVENRPSTYERHSALSQGSSTPAASAPGRSTRSSETHADRSDDSYAS